MKKKGYVFVILIFTLVCLLHSNVDVDKELYSLVNDVIQKFKDISVSGKIDHKAFNLFITEYLVKAKKLKKEGKIDAHFFNRYRQILGVLLLTITNNPEGILNPILRDTLEKFETLDEYILLPEKSISNNLASVASVISKELIDLHLYLTNINIPNPYRQKLFSGDKKTIPFYDLIEKNGFFYKDGQSKPFTGIAIKKYWNGQLEDTITFKNGKMEGQRVQYHDDEVKAAEGNMKNNVKTGTWIYYDYSGEVKGIYNCNPQLRAYFRDYQKDMEHQNWESALKSLKQAIRVTPLPILQKLGKEFPKHQSVSCKKSYNWEGALKFARIWAKKVTSSITFNQQEKAEALYQLGSLCWERVYMYEDKLSKKEKEELITEGFRALNDSLKYDDPNSFLYAKMSLLYREKAKLYPDQKDKYLKLAAENKQKSKAISKTDKYTPFTLYGIEEPKEEDTSESTKKPVNVYEIKKDDLSDIFSPMIRLPRPPPPPIPLPPTPPKRKK